jgi:hypothetical protein
MTEIDLLEIMAGRGLHIRTRQESWAISLPEELQSDEFLRAITSGRSIPFESKGCFSLPLELSNPPSEAWEVEFWASVEQQDASELREAFDRYLPELKGHWDWFESHKTKFLDFRDKLIAHLDVILVGEK